MTENDTINDSNGRRVRPNSALNHTTGQIQMALIEARNKLMLLAGVRRANWEQPPTEEQEKQINDSDTIVRFRCEPGNGSSYDLTYTIRMIPQRVPGPHYSDPEAVKMIQGYTLTWWTGSAGESIQWDETSHLQGPWFAEKMGTNRADADGLLMLLDALGHSVSFCLDHTKPTPVTVEECDEGVTNATR